MPPSGWKNSIKRKSIKFGGIKDSRHLNVTIHYIIMDSLNSFRIRLHFRYNSGFDLLSFLYF